MLLRNQSGILLHYNVQGKPNTKVQKHSVKIWKKLFNPENVKQARSNLSKDEKKALKEIKSWEDKVVSVKDKGSKLFALENEVYEEKIQEQIDRRSIKGQKDDPSKLF